jgi:hypothetical protein
LFCGSGILTNADTSTQMQISLNNSQNKHYGDKSFTNSAYNVENWQQLVFYTE